MEWHVNMFGKWHGIDAIGFDVVKFSAILFFCLPSSQNFISWFLRWFHAVILVMKIDNNIGLLSLLKNSETNILSLSWHIFFCKGYALIEYEKFEQAENAIASMNGGTLLEQIIYVDWAFSNGPSNWASRRKNMRSVSMPCTFVSWKLLEMIYY